MTINTRAGERDLEGAYWMATPMTALLPYRMGNGHQVEQLEVGCRHCRASLPLPSLRGTVVEISPSEILVQVLAPCEACAHWSVMHKRLRSVERAYTTWSELLAGARAWILWLFWLPLTTGRRARARLLHMLCI